MCYLYSYYLMINRNHSSVIKRYTILQWFIYVQKTLTDLLWDAGRSLVNRATQEYSE